MEIFTFVKMGGSRERITLKQISADAVDALSHFDASRAQCFHFKDRHKLLAVIEVGFGTLTPFNKLVRRLLTSDQGAEAPKGSLATASTTRNATGGMRPRPRQGDKLKIEIETASTIDEVLILMV